MGRQVPIRAGVGASGPAKGERREAGIQWIQPPKAVSDPEFRQTTSGAHGSANRADCLPRGKPFGAPAGASSCPRRGLTRRLRRGLGLAVPRGAHTFLSVAKEKCAKESQRHGDSGKKPFIAHFDGGARNVARNGVGQLTHTGGARSCSPFSAVKMGGPFSLRCLSPLCSPAVGGGQAYPLRVGMFSGSLGIFAAQKASGISNPRWPLLRAMRPVAEWRSESANRQETTPDRRAVAPVVPRR